jgi:hypothetical protein
MSKMNELHCDLVDLGSVKVRQIEDEYLKLLIGKRSYNIARQLLFKKYNVAMTTLEWILSKAATHATSDWLAKLEMEDAYGRGEPDDY